MDKDVGDAFGAAPTYHDYKCCLDQHPGWAATDKLQQACADKDTQYCKDIKTDDNACRTADLTKTAYYSVGYKTTDCNNYADDCQM